MSFNELNSVENFIIHRLSGVNLNETRNYPSLADDHGIYGDYRWKYVPAEMLQREVTDVLVESELTEALCRLNPDIQAHPEYAEEVIMKLRTILLSVNNIGLVRANQEFARFLRGEITMPFGKNFKHVPVRLVDFE